MLPEIEKDLEKIVSTLKKHEEIEAIYLFGSHANGQSKADSDLDIAIISKDRETRILDLMSKYGWELFDIVDRAIDLLVYYPEEFTQKANLEVTMESSIFHEGIKIYG